MLSLFCEHLQRGPEHLRRRARARARSPARARSRAGSRERIRERSRERINGRLFGLGQAAGDRPNFGGLVLGCIEADFCK